LQALKHLHFEDDNDLTNNLVGNFSELTNRLMLEGMKNGAILHHYWWFYNFDILISKEVGDLVKAKSITWYSNFFMTQYDNQRWVEHFRMTKKVVLQFTKKLKCLIEKKVTKYRCVIHVGMRVACSLYKISHGVNYLQCSEMFAIGKSLINMILHELFVL